MKKQTPEFESLELKQEILVDAVTAETKPKRSKAKVEVLEKTENKPKVAKTKLEEKVEIITSELTGFEHLGLKKALLESIASMGFKKPSPIQEQAIPVVLGGKDIIAQAHTGTGKTAAFALPCLQKLKNTGHVEMLVIAPTRELANQVSDEIFSFGKNMGIKTVTIFGGQSYTQQIDRVKRGAQVVVATPGRLLDLLKGERLGNFSPSMVILDEADEMLDMGFLDDIQEIFTFLPEERQTLMFSATMPKPIQNLANKILKDPQLVSVNREEDGAVNKNIEELYCVIDENERDDAIVRLIDTESPDKTVIFCRTKSEVDRLSTVLMARGHSAKGLHGDMEQRQREEVIKSFQSGKIQILIATDVAARGLDIRGVSHVMNFHIPFEAENYVHRIGRTGRAGEKGIAITLVTPREFRELKKIKNTVGSQMNHRKIPTRQDVQRKNGERIVLALADQKIHAHAGEYFENLVDSMGIEQAAQKMMSYILESEAVEGPEKIGIDGDRLNRFFFEMEKQEERRGFGDRGRSGGGFRRSGGFRDRGGFGRDRGDRKDFGDRKPFGDRGGFSGDRGEKRSFGDRDAGFNRDRGDRKDFGDRKPFGDRGGFSGDRGEKRSFGDRDAGFNRDRGDRKDFGDRKPFGDRGGFSRDQGEKRPFKRRESR